MKIFKRIIFITSIIIVAIIIGIFFYIGRAAKLGLPDYSADIQLKGRIAPVKVYRDSLAIPHIYARNEHDLYMVTGYLLAQDRIWQMDLLRRVTLGRLSEIFGDDFIQTDLLLRSLNFSEKSENILKEADTSIVVALKSFSEGVNSYLEDNKGDYPLEFTLLGYDPDSWDPVHSLNLIGYMAWDLKSGWSELLLEELSAKVDNAHVAELLPDMSIQKTYVYRDNSDLLSANKLQMLSRLEDMGLDIFSGSNNWAVSGNRSTTGKPLLANDMHLSFGIPGIWYQIHQVIEGRLNVEGLILPGQPLVIVGHNDSIAWGMTNTYVDNLDYYEEKINPQDSNQYLFNGEWKNFVVHNEVIRSKSGKVVKCNYRTNHRGPVVSAFKDIPDRVLTIHWVGSEKSNEMRSVYLADRAQNWDDFRNAFSSFISISQNIVYADRKGNIGLYCCAGVPIRKRDKVWAVLPGSTDEYDWKGMVPFNELPHEFNPARGYVSSANNRTVDSTYPYHIGTWYDLPYRMDRIRTMLDGKEIFTVADFMKMQNDQHSNYSALFLTAVLPALNGRTDWSQTENTALEMLRKWDYNLDAGSPEAAIAECWAYQFIVSTYKDEMGDDLFKKFLDVSQFPRIAMHYLLHHNNSVWLDNVTTPEKEGITDIAVESFRNAIDTLTKQMGKKIQAWKWGDIHQITLKHPLAKVKLLDMIFGLNHGPYPVGGSFHTVSPYKYPYFVPQAVDHGSSHRSIYDLSDWSNCISVIPTGTSGIPASRFYCDQTEMYINGKYHPDYYKPDAVKAHALFEMQFIPAASY
jgi:penicillin amidase